MNWDAIGAIAELLAAIGVIISLIFVGLQVRKSNEEARTATMQATTDTEMMMVQIFAEHAEVWDKVSTGKELDSGTETRKGILMANMLMIDYENRFHQYLAGNFDESSWQNRLEILQSFVSLPIYDTWRNSLGGRSHGADFLALIDEMAIKNRDES